MQKLLFSTNAIKNAKIFLCCLATAFSSVFSGIKLSAVADAEAAATKAVDFLIKEDGDRSQEWKFTTFSKALCGTTEWSSDVTNLLWEIQPVSGNQDSYRIVNVTTGFALTATADGDPIGGYKPVLMPVNENNQAQIWKVLHFTEESNNFYNLVNLSLSKVLELNTQGRVWLWNHNSAVSNYQGNPNLTFAFGTSTVGFFITIDEAIAISDGCRLIRYNSADYSLKAGSVEGWFIQNRESGAYLSNFNGTLCTEAEKIYSSKQAWNIREESSGISLQSAADSQYVSIDSNSDTTTSETAFAIFLNSDATINTPDEDTYYTLDMTYGGETVSLSEYSSEFYDRAVDFEANNEAYYSQQWTFKAAEASAKGTTSWTTTSDTEWVFIKDTNSNFYRLKNKDTGLVLAARLSSDGATYTPVLVPEYSTDNYQLWSVPEFSVSASPTGGHNLVNKATNEFLFIGTDGTVKFKNYGNAASKVDNSDDGSNVILGFSSKGTDLASFETVLANNGETSLFLILGVDYKLQLDACIGYNIVNKNSGGYLTNRDSELKTSKRLYTDGSQVWTVADNTSGGIRLENKAGSRINAWVNGNPYVKSIQINSDCKLVNATGDALAEKVDSKTYAVSAVAVNPADSRQDWKFVVGNKFAVTTTGESGVLATVTDKQYWNFEQVDGTYYRIINKELSLALTEENSMIVLSSISGDDAQLWQLGGYNWGGNTVYNFINKSSGKYLRYGAWDQAVGNLSMVEPHQSGELWFSFTVDNGTSFVTPSNGLSAQICLAAATEHRLYSGMAKEYRLINRNSGGWLSANSGGIFTSDMSYADNSQYWGISILDSCIMLTNKQYNAYTISGSLNGDSTLTSPRTDVYYSIEDSNKAYADASPARLLDTNSVKAGKAEATQNHRWKFVQSGNYWYIVNSLTGNVLTNLKGSLVLSPINTDYEEQLWSINEFADPWAEITTYNLTSKVDGKYVSVSTSGVITLSSTNYTFNEAFVLFENDYLTLSDGVLSVLCSNNNADSCAIICDVSYNDERYIYLSSTDGNDVNDGSSPEKAIRTIDKLNEMISSRPLAAGNKIYFKRGNSFVGEVNIKNVYGLKDHPIYIGSYGDQNLNYPDIKAPAPNGTTTAYASNSTSRPQDANIYSSIRIVNSTYITIENITAWDNSNDGQTYYSHYSNRNAIVWIYSCQGITVRNMIINGCINNRIKSTLADQKDRIYYSVDTGNQYPYQGNDYYGLVCANAFYTTVTDKSNVIIENVTVTNTIGVAVDASQFTVKNCNIYNMPAWGLIVSGDNGTVEDCTFKNTGGGKNSAGNAAIMAVSASDIIFNRLSVSEIKRGSQNYDGVGFDFENSCYNCTLENSEFKNIEGSAIMFMDNINKGITVKNIYITEYNTKNTNEAAVKLWTNTNKYDVALKDISVKKYGTNPYYGKDGNQNNLNGVTLEGCLFFESVRTNGDLSYDDSVNWIDALIARRWMVTGIGAENMVDMNSDGDTDICDAVKMILASAN